MGWGDIVAAFIRRGGRVTALRLTSVRLTAASLCAFVALTVVCAARAQAPDSRSVEVPDALMLAQQFEEARLAGDYAKAIRLGDAALTSMAATPAEATVQPADILLGLAEAHARLGENALALQNCQRALKLREQTLEVDHPDLVPILQQIVDLHLQLGRYAEAAAQLQRIAAIERAAYGERHPNVLATLRRLRDTYEKAGQPNELAATQVLIKQLDTAERAVPLTRGKPRTDRRYKLDAGFATVRVFYGTNRAATGAVKPAAYYGTARGELDVGYLDVSIPEVHKEGELETQSRWSLLTYDVDPDARRRFVLLNKVMPLSKAAFVNALQRQVSGAPTRDVFLFIHGFNSSFEDAARRTAQLAYDLDFDGTPMMYSWPSQASTTAYTVDEAAVGISSRKFAGFLESVVDLSGAERIHLIAHSMGNRALIEGLETYLSRRAPDRPKRVFGQIVFTAPDVDRDYFLETVASVRDSAARVTLYASDNDLALKTSQKIHGAPRAGLAGAGIITLPWLDTIDMSAVQADMLGHSYFAANAGAIYDLFRMLWRDEPPAQRCGMVDRRAADARIWRFNVDVCAGQDLLFAGVLFKRFGVQAKSRARARLNRVVDEAQKQEWSRILTRLDTLLQAPNE